MTARMWTYVTLTGKVIFKFTDDRTRDGPGGPSKTLGRFKGCLIVDEYSGFDRLCKKPGMSRAGCWAHARRKVFDAKDEDQKRSSRLLYLIRRLFWIESAAAKRQKKDLSFCDCEVGKLRKRRSMLIVDRIMEFAKLTKSDVLPSSGLGKAITYLVGNEDHLRTFLRDPKVPMTNNASERALRSIALGRKNYLHFGSLDGGDTGAVFYSLIGACKLLGINPSTYLNDTTTALLTNPDTPRDQLTPWAWASARTKQAIALLSTQTPVTSPESAPSDRPAESATTA